MTLAPNSDIDGVLVVAHGTIADLDELPAFLTSIRRGRPPGEALIQEMRRRYSAIRGFPLLTTTRAQAEALSLRIGKPVLVGMRFGEPSIERALRQFEQGGAQQLLILPIAPYSVNLYAQEVRTRYRVLQAQGDQASAARRAIRLDSVEPWGSHPGLVEAHVNAIRRFASAPLARGASVVLSAHSLPSHVIEAGDRYGVEVEACARSIEKALGHEIRLGFQSQGKDGGRWLGPDLKEVVSDIAASGQRCIVVAPFGFLSDHVETLYDLDVELREYTDSLGVELVRVPALGVDSGLVDTLVELVNTAPIERSEAH